MRLKVIFEDENMKSHLLGPLTLMAKSAVGINSVQNNVRRTGMTGRQFHQQNRFLFHELRGVV